MARKESIKKFLSAIALIKKSNDAFFFENLGVRANITQSQFFVLDEIGGARVVMIKDLAEIMAITPSATTQLVDVLVSRGYVSRKSDINDRRAVAIVVTQKGKKKIKEINELRIKYFSKILKKINDRDLERLIESFTKMYNSL
jgi:DNA-binding MarR family transcriptional regulator